MDEQKQDLAEKQEKRSRRAEKKAVKEAAKASLPPENALPVAKRFLTFERRKSFCGIAFISPWIIGVIIFFLIPMVMAICYTFSNIQILNGQFTLTPVEWDNYKWAFTEDATFVKDELTPSLTSMFWQVPIIIIFSTFIAMLIKDKFHGRTLARAIFFLPVIVSSGVVISIMKNSILSGQSVGATTNTAAYMFSAPSFTDIFNTLGVPANITSIVSSVVNEVFDLTWKSGVQILLLLAAINNIPSTSYEVADMEGATAWEKFWKITLPMISSTMLVTVIYTIIDYFTDADNAVMQRMMDLLNKGTYDKGTTIAVIYCLFVLLLIGILQLIVGRHVFYYND